MRRALPLLLAFLGCTDPPYSQPLAPTPAAPAPTPAPLACAGCMPCGGSWCQQGERCEHPVGDCAEASGRCVPSGNPDACAQIVAVVCMCDGRSLRAFNGCEIPTQGVRSEGPCPGGGPIEDIRPQGVSLGVDAPNPGAERPSDQSLAIVYFDKESVGEVDRRKIAPHLGKFRACLLRHAKENISFQCKVEIDVRADGSASKRQVECSSSPAELTRCFEEALAQRGWEATAHLIRFSFRARLRSARG